MQYRDRQTLLDIALEESGTAQAAIEAAINAGIPAANPDGKHPALQTEKEFDGGDAQNATVRDRYARENRHSATAEKSKTKRIGICYWTIGVDFVVT